MYILVYIVVVLNAYTSIYSGGTKCIYLYSGTNTVV